MLITLRAHTHTLRSAFLRLPATVLHGIGMGVGGVPPLHLLASSVLTPALITNILLCWAHRRGPSVPAAGADRNPSFCCLWGQSWWLFRAGYSDGEGFYSPLHSGRFCTVEVTLITTFTANANGCQSRPAAGCCLRFFLWSLLRRLLPCKSVFNRTRQMKGVQKHNFHPLNCTNWTWSCPQVNPPHF